jgi:hypothetical protein
MSTGVLLYSFDTNKTKYSKITERCISHIRHHLDLPITVVGDQQFDYTNSVIIEPQKYNKRRYNKEIVPWYNMERADAYWYSPYETTILMDCDYFILSNDLLRLSQNTNDILLHNKVHDITGRNNIQSSHEALIPIIWATMVIFKKNNFVEKIFQLIKHIQLHYQHYKRLYRIKFDSFRNDYAFAIALHQIYGQYKDDYTIPTPMHMMGADANILDLNFNRVNFSWKDQWASVQNHDVHIFDKEYFNV